MQDWPLVYLNKHCAKYNAVPELYMIILHWDPCIHALFWWLLIWTKHSEYIFKSILTRFYKTGCSKFRQPIDVIITTTTTTTTTTIIIITIIIIIIIIIIITTIIIIIIIVVVIVIIIIIDAIVLIMLLLYYHFHSFLSYPFFTHRAWFYDFFCVIALYVTFLLSADDIMKMISHYHGRWVSTPEYLM